MLSKTKRPRGNFRGLQRGKTVLPPLKQVHESKGFAGDPPFRLFPKLCLPEPSDMHPRLLLDTTFHQRLSRCQRQNCSMLSVYWVCICSGHHFYSCGYCVFRPLMASFSSACLNAWCGVCFPTLYEQDAVSHIMPALPWPFSL